MPLRTFYIIIKSDYVDNKGYLNLFPWMKIHGSIEGYSVIFSPFIQLSFPWMKIHGSIEGVSTA